MKPLPGRLGAALLTFVAVLAVGTTLRLIGGPESARNARLDERRAKDLEQLAQWIVRPYGLDGHAPERLSGAVPEHLSLTDPATDEPYDYRPGPDGGFAICTTITEPLLFAWAQPRSLVHNPALRVGESWDASSGRFCLGTPGPPGEREPR